MSIVAVVVLLCLTRTYQMEWRDLVLMVEGRSNDKGG